MKNTDYTWQLLWLRLRKMLSQFYSKETKDNFSSKHFSLSISIIKTIPLSWCSLIWTRLLIKSDFSVIRSFHRFQIWYGKTSLRKIKFVRTDIQISATHIETHTIMRFVHIRFWYSSNDGTISCLSMMGMGGFIKLTATHNPTIMIRMGFFRRFIP